MPGKIKVKVLAGRNLPVMDRAGDTTDAFVEIKFGGVTHKTDVCRKSLNPHWNSTEWYRFEVDESELQDEPLQLRLMDHDTYSANDAIGKVVISLAPLLAREANNTKGTAASHPGAVMSGWIPVFDTMHGIRGELNVIVKVELFSDFNKYKTSSCGVQFFHCPTIPPGYRASAIHGFVEELVVNDDPEYQWIDKIRTPRASNEARQVAFIKLSNQVQRLVGLKAAELGANAVVGYQQDFDLEGEAGVVARAIGTAVSITPLPTPSQPINIPPCTQQQLKKYLDILANDNDSITDLNEYFQHHQDELLKLLSILNPKTPAFLDEAENNEDDDRDLSSLDLTRQSSLKGYAGNVSIYQDFSQNSLRHLSEDQTDLNRLLNREDSDDSTGPLRKLKNIRSNFFVKRLGSLRSRKSVQSDDQISIKSNSSDSSRISLTDIKNEFKKLKKLKKPKFRKTKGEEDGIGMASVLARSVIHAHTSLACIAETQDSEPSPSSTMRRTSESEPTINVSDDDKTRQGDVENVSDPKISQNDKKIPAIHFTSLTNINAEIQKTLMSNKTVSESCPTTPIVSRSENLLKLPGEPGYFGSVSSALSADSSEIYSSSDEDDESSDQRTDTEKSFETTSSVVRSVLNHEVNPQLINQMDKKLSILQMASPELHEITPSEITEEEIQEDQLKVKNVSSDKETAQNTPQKIKLISDKDLAEATSSAHKDIDTLVHPKSNTHHFKLHNPFAHKKSESMSAPSSPVEKKSFVYRSSKRIKRQLSKISKSSMIKSLSHYSLIPNKKHAQTGTPISQPSSASDVPSKFPSHETVLGAPFLSYTDLLSLDKEVVDDNNKVLHKSNELDHTHVKMYIGSEPVSRASLSGPSSPGYKDEAHLYEHKLKKDKISVKPTGLVHTAMETILIDKVQSLLIPTSPDLTKTKEEQFFYNVTDKLVKVEEDRNKKEIFMKHPDIHNTETESIKEGLIKTAVETMLVDKLQSILPPLTSDPINVLDNQLAENESDILTNMKIQIRDEKNENLDKTEIKKKDSLVHTAMETILIDKMQALLPSPIENVRVDENIHNKNKPVTSVEAKAHKVRNQEISKNKESLFHTAIQTMLIDKVQTLIPTENINVNESEYANDKCVKDATKSNNNNNIADDTSDGLIHTAVETMLIDKIQTMLPPATYETDVIIEKPKNENESQIERAVEIITENITHGHDTEPNIKDSLLHTAMEAMLIDKFQSIYTPLKANEKDESVPKNTEESRDEIESETKIRNTKLETKSDSKEKRDKKLVRQDSIHSVTEEPQMSKGTNKKTILQHFHPIKSGKPLETIPSLPESNLDFAESLDIEGVDTNSVGVSVCNNSHAAWDVDRSERKEEKEKEKGSPRHARHESYGGREPVLPANASLHSSSTPLGIHRRSSDSDLSITPKGSSLNTSLGNTGTGGGAILRPSMNSNNLEMLEYPFLTMTEYPPGFIVHIGGTVCARSVKLVDGGGSGGESAARAACWAELRTELRAHARALRCNAVIAYADTAAICEDVCVLSASGTAAVINLDCDFNADIDAQTAVANGTKTMIEEIDADACSIAHVPYSPGTGPYRAELSACGGCRRARVPAVLLATCAKPNRLKSYGKAVTVTAVAARVRRAPPAGEPGARDISDQLPFLEYELHKMLLAKLNMQGANALFSLQTQIAVGERCVMALASGTAIRLAALPPPTPPRIKASENDKNALEIQKALWDSFTANKAANGYDVALEHNANGVLPEVEGDDPPVLDLCADKDACVLELDEAEDVETAKALASRRTHMQVYTNNLKATPGAMPFAFAQVWRARLTLTSQGCPSPAAERHVRRALDGVIYKLRRLQPCALITPRFQLDLPEDEIQLVISGAAVSLVDPSKPEPVAKPEHAGHHGNGTGDADDDIFALDEEQLVKSQEVVEEKPSNGHIPTSVCLTTLSAVSGARIVTRVCALRLLFVRETTYVRELGGVSGLSHTFTCEVLAIVRAYTAALGGNALTSFYLTQLMLQDNAHKNQGQCLLSVGGDVVHITY